MEDIYKKVNHKVTIKKYGLLTWYCYHYKNYFLFRLATQTISSLVGLVLAMLLLVQLLKQL